MMGEVWGKHLKNKRKTLVLKMGIFYFLKKRVFVFFHQMESHVCTWDLNQATRLQNHPGRKVVWNCIEAEISILRQRGDERVNERNKMEE